MYSSTLNISLQNIQIFKLTIFCSFHLQGIFFEKFFICKKCELKTNTSLSMNVDLSKLRHPSVISICLSWPRSEKNAIIKLVLLSFSCSIEVPVAQISFHMNETGWIIIYKSMYSMIWHLVLPYKIVIAVNTECHDAPRTKVLLQGRRFQSIDESKVNETNQLMRISKEDFSKCFESQKGHWLRYEVWRRLLWKRVWRHYRR